MSLIKKAKKPILIVLLIAGAAMLLYVVGDMFGRKQLTMPMFVGGWTIGMLLFAVPAVFLLKGKQFEELPEEQRKKLITPAGAVIVLVFIIAMGYGLYKLGGYTGYSGTADGVCKSCGRSFSDSSNTTNIAKTGMCNNCYNNFEWGQEVTGE